MVDHMIALLAMIDDVIMIMIKIPGKAVSLPNQHMIAYKFRQNQM